MKIGIIGAGHVGAALGTGWTRAGHTVTFGVRDPSGEKAQQLADGTAVGTASVADAAADAEVVVLAVPWAAVEDALRSAGDLTGKIVIDCTNPLGAGLSLAHGHTTSGGELVAEQAPGARVVKCFNSVGFNVTEQPQFDGRRAMMALAGDDEGARTTVAALARDLGFEPLDCGPLQNARLIEPLAALWIWQAMNGMGREFAFGLLRR